jgi:Holliday junction DNA helicase RuvA
MIARLRGTFVGRAGAASIIDVNGVGYAVHVPQSVNLVLDDLVVLHVSTQVREDAITLYGFPTAEEREAFDMLHSISKIGPKTALAVLGHLDVESIGRAIANDDIVTLTRVPGIGKKTAESLCFELKDKFPVMFLPTVTPLHEAGDPLPLALAQLAYRKSEIDRVLGSRDVPKPDDAPLQDRIRAALRVLSGPQ